MTFYQALRYPFQGSRWFTRVLTLAVVQFIPIVGQLILLGYGLRVVKAIYANQPALPPIPWGRAFKDGLRLAAAVLLYICPILVGVPTFLTIGTTVTTPGASAGSGGTLRIVLVTVLTLIVVPLFRQLEKRGIDLRFLNKALRIVVPIVLVATLAMTFAGLPTLFNAGPRTLNGIGVGLCILIGILVFVIVIALCMGGVRYATTGKGIFDAPGNARLMLKNPASTGRLILNFVLLLVLGLIAVSVGTVLLILPGLFMIVVFSLAIWSLFAHYGLQSDLIVSRLPDRSLHMATAPLN